MYFTQYLAASYSPTETASRQPFTNDFPRADIYELITPDLLHQVIKGGFKDHLVTWVCDYLENKHGKTRAGAILDDIDRRYAHLTICLSLFVLMSRVQHCSGPALPRIKALPSRATLQAMDR